MSFRVQETSYGLIRSLRETVVRLSRMDRDLSHQIRRAASSVALNIAEANGRDGKDRLHHFRVARGSAFEVQAGLRVAEAWGLLGEAQIRPPLAIAAEVIGVLGALLR